MPLAASQSRVIVGIAGTSVTPDDDDLIRRGVGGVVLFDRNVTDDPRQVLALTTDLKRRAAKHGRPLIVCVDQEGGRVRRLRGPAFAAVPSMRAVGATADPAVARRAGRVIGRDLRAVGIDLNFAPVLDVDTNPDNPVIGDRSFAADPATVARMAIAFAAGLRDAGVAACGKHFPGHGDTSQDSHHDLPRLDHGLARLRAVELAPFAAAAGSLDAIMTAHVLFPSLDAAYPATMSRPIVNGLLRGAIGYDGPVVSDDLDMAAIAARHEVEEVVARGADAGVDLFLVCHSPDRQHRAIDALERMPPAAGATSARRYDGLVAACRDGRNRERATRNEPRP